MHLLHVRARFGCALNLVLFLAVTASFAGAAYLAHHRPCDLAFITSPSWSCLDDSSSISVFLLDRRGRGEASSISVFLLDRKGAIRPPSMIHPPSAVHGEGRGEAWQKKGSGGGEQRRGVERVTRSASELAQA